MELREINKHNEITPLNMSKSRQVSTNDVEMTKTTIDEIFNDVPVALFHYRLLFMCGLCFMADAMEVSLLYFLSTCAGAEWDLSDGEQASITGVVFAGEILGSTFWGPLADKFGRRLTFLISSFLIAGNVLITIYLSSSMSVSY
jgi:Na+/melibiose symporter-like transporter